MMPALTAAECFFMLVLAGVSYCFGNTLIRYCYDRLPDDAKPSDADAAGQNTNAKQDTHHKSRINGVVGDLERVLYIYAVVRNQYALISGWIVLKAFFGWVSNTESQKRKLCDAEAEQVQNAGAKCTPAQQHMDSYRKYCLYIYGNGLSLAIGIACGEIALFLAKVVS